MATKKNEEKDLMELYNRLRSVPREALKVIPAGKLKGFSDVNPMWRIKILTEVLGTCGFGWKYEIVRFWLEGTQEISAFCHINLYIKVDGEWSAPIPGIGGASFIAATKNGYQQSDECYKMALTDAISVACKAIGVAADIYYEKDKTKYSTNPQPPAPTLDPRKIFPPERRDDESLMAWIHRQSEKAKSGNKRFSLSNLLNSLYIITEDDINAIAQNYNTYIINNNLTY